MYCSNYCSCNSRPVLENYSKTYNRSNNSYIEPYQWYNPTDWTLKSTCNSQCDKEKADLKTALKTDYERQKADLTKKYNDSLNSYKSITCPPSIPQVNTKTNIKYASLIKENWRS